MYAPKKFRSSDNDNKIVTCFARFVEKLMTWPVVHNCILFAQFFNENDMRSVCVDTRKITWGSTFLSNVILGCHSAD
jgi:hypothetical protein